MTQPECIVTKSQRGGDLIHYDGYSYTVQHSWPVSQQDYEHCLLRCSKKRRNRCSGQLQCKRIKGDDLNDAYYHCIVSNSHAAGCIQDREAYIHTQATDEILSRVRGGESLTLAYNEVITTAPMSLRNIHPSVQRKFRPKKSLISSAKRRLRQQENLSNTSIY